MENRKNAIKIFGKFVAFWLWNCGERLKKVLQCYSVYDSIITETKHSLRGTCRKEF